MLDIDRRRTRVFLWHIHKKYAPKLCKNRVYFDRATHTKKLTFLTLVATHGVIHNKYYLATVDQEITIDALFLT